MEPTRLYGFSLAHLISDVMSFFSRNKRSETHNFVFINLRRVLELSKRKGKKNPKFGNRKSLTLFLSNFL
jgi:hypothetical protein